MKNKIKVKNISKFIKIQLWITLLFLVAYLITLSFGDKDNFFTDLNNKKRVAGSMVSAMIRIFGPPSQPLLSGNTFCSEGGLTAVRLEWPNVIDALSYNVNRDGFLVAAGITDNFFVDQNLVGSINYTYQVVAIGPAGEATSAPLVILAKECEEVVAHYISVDTFDGKSVLAPKGILETENRRPVFSGKSSLINSQIELEIWGNEATYVRVVTNQNGFWQWSPSADINHGDYVMYAKLINLADGSLLAQDIFYFSIAKEDESTDKIKTKKIELKETTETLTKKEKKPFNLDISLTNDTYIRGVNISNEAYRGESIRTNIYFSDVVAENIPMNISYVLVDSNGHKVAQYIEDATLKENLIIEKTIPLPLSLDLGEYKLIISATIDGVTVGNESIFILKDRPLVKIGDNIYLTYNDLLGNLSWFVIGSTSFLSFFSVAAFREHYLYKRAVFHVTEKVLKRKGFIN